LPSTSELRLAEVMGGIGSTACAGEVTTQGVQSAASEEAPALLGDEALEPLESDSREHNGIALKPTETDSSERCKAELHGADAVELRPGAEQAEQPAGLTSSVLRAEASESGAATPSLPAAPASEELEAAARKHLTKKAASKKAAVKKPAAAAKKQAHPAASQRPAAPGCPCQPSSALLPGQRPAQAGEKRCPLARLTQDEVDAEFQAADPEHDPLQQLPEDKRKEIIAHAKKRAAGYEKLGKTIETECHQQ